MHIHAGVHGETSRFFARIRLSRRFFSLLLFLFLFSCLLLSLSVLLELSFPVREIKLLKPAFAIRTESRNSNGVRICVLEIILSWRIVIHVGSVPVFFSFSFLHIWDRSVLVKAFRHSKFLSWNILLYLHCTIELALTKDIVYQHFIVIVYSLLSLSHTLSV